ncbi:MAG TPA: ABC transporter substrate-binding protein [Clostridiaceae bacterium]|nr:ABC transporter substrate-binding protein [Clostridiaceae bacterium]
MVSMVAVFFAGCTVSQSSSNEIKIGLNYELSGKVASYGNSSVDGILLAFEKINEAGGVLGKKINPIKMDNKSDSAEATSVATRLATQEKVVAILGPATSGAFKATIPVATKNKIPVLSASTTADDVTVDENGVKEFAFKICFNDNFQGTVMAKFALEKLNAKSAVIIFDNSSDYSIGLSKSFKETFTNGGGKIVTEEAYVAGDTDFNAILTKIKSMDFDIIYIPGYYEEVGLIIKQARALEINVPVLGGDGFDSPQLAELAGKEALNQVYFSNHYSSLYENPKVTDFIESFKAKYNKEPDAFAALGYDLGYFIADAIQRAGTTDTVKIKDALEATQNFEGVTGTISIDENHNAVKSAIIIELKDGEQASAIKYDP